ncbi:MAG: hypothetical protein KTR20_14520 [Cellvibrionaceae bacterium]|nr:hypothetical protein [Cellvibrionaceae bacterium]
MKNLLYVPNVHLLVNTQLVIISAMLCSLPVLAQNTVEVSGKIEFEISAYADQGQFADQDYRYNGALAAEPEFYWSWREGNSSLNFKPFLRLDQQDTERNHGDIRELLWTHVNNRWEWRGGIGKVFWGVTEFNHLVDIINQSDTVDAFDGEQKLGQPMINLSYVSDWGIIDGFILPGFRERTFAGEGGRLRAGVIVDTDNPAYESSKQARHIDTALRWSHSLDVYDIGAYIFSGTDRNPILQPSFVNGHLRLRPYYQQIHQLGVDVQATIGSWLGKLETLYQEAAQDKFVAVQTGVEYTFYGINNSAADMGLLLEYGWDERGRNASALAQNDIYLGTRITLNDSNDTALLMGGSYDVDYHSKTLLLEASRRLSDYWTIALDALVFIDGDAADSASALAEDDRVQLTLERYL